jgi:hypothetical protein
VGGSFWRRSVGLKGVDPVNLEAVEKLVMDKLAEIKRDGFTPGAIEAAVNTLEFRCVGASGCCGCASRPCLRRARHTEEGTAGEEV